MNKTTVAISFVTAGVLALAGCSAGQGTSAGQTAASAAALNVAAAPIVSPANSPTTAPAPGPASSTRLITAEGIGTVTGTPDVVTVGLGVETNAASASGALDDNNTRAAAVIAVLKKNGVAPADLQTSQLSINPNFDKNNQITGYQVTNMVTAKLRKIAGAGALIDAVGKVAGNAVRVQQLTFSIDNDSALRATARADAVRQAQAQAEQMADAAGVKLGPIYSITESPTDSPINVVAPETFAASSAAVPIESGSQDLSVVVQVVYEIAS